MFQLKKSNIPNVLTIFRIVLILPILVLIFLDQSSIYIYSFTINGYKSSISPYFLIAGIIFLLSALTDWLDGYLARKYNQVSEFGKIWDPIADKAMINSVIIALTFIGDVPIYISIALIFRDIIIDGYRMQALFHNKDVAANFWGKIKTTILFVGVLIIMFIFNSDNDETFPSSWEFYVLQNGALHLGLVASFISGTIYIINFHKK